MDVGSGVGSADPDVVQPAVVTGGQYAANVDNVATNAGLWFGFCCGLAAGLRQARWPAAGRHRRRVVAAFGLEEGNVVVRFETAREDRMFWG